VAEGVAMSPLATLVPASVAPISAIEAIKAEGTHRGRPLVRRIMMEPFCGRLRSRASPM